SDAATLSLFGYDPLEVYTGRAPLEAAAQGIKLGHNDWAIRCNLVTIQNGRMADFTAGHIARDDAKPLMESLNSALSRRFTHLGAELEFHPGVSYRNLLIYRSSLPAPFSKATLTRPPHDIPDQEIASYLPRGPGSELLRSLMEESCHVLSNHPVNQKSRSRGRKQSTQIWLWGLGKAPQLLPFATTYRKTGAIVSAVDLVRGVGVLLGWKRIDVPGATGYLDTDYRAKGEAGVQALNGFDLVCVHIEAPDEASHEGKADAKVQAIEEIDRHIVGPLLDALQRFGE